MSTYQVVIQEQPPANGGFRYHWWLYELVDGQKILVSRNLGEYSYRMSEAEQSARKLAQKVEDQKDRPLEIRRVTFEVSPTLSKKQKPRWWRRNSAVAAVID